MSIEAFVIIGAGRSGTNMLRDVLTRAPNVGTWPCDEINYIWRHGNARYPNDEFEPGMASKAVISFIRRAFDSIAREMRVTMVVEKTCANSLRVSFVDKVLPDGKFLFIYRDGRDAVASAMKRWVAPLDLPYILKKARYVPLADAPYYGALFIKNRIHRMFSKEKRLSFWGPRVEGIQEIVRSRTLLEVCGYQWARCVERALDQLGDIDNSRVHRVKYEDFVSDPKRQIKSITQFLRVSLSEGELEGVVGGVTSKSVGNWQRAFDERKLKTLEPIIKNAMMRLGYW
jgi:hypothetical protein